MASHLARGLLGSWRDHRAKIGLGRGNPRVGVTAWGWQHHLQPLGAPLPRGSSPYSSGTGTPRRCPGHGHAAGGGCASPKPPGCCCGIKADKRGSPEAEAGVPSPKIGIVGCSIVLLAPRCPHGRGNVPKSRWPRGWVGKLLLAVVQEAGGTSQGWDHPGLPTPLSPAPVLFIAVPGGVTNPKTPPVQRQGHR